MNNIVYVVCNEALHHDSSYHDVIEVCGTKEKAKVVIESQAADIIKQIDRGDFGDDFDDYIVTTDFRDYDYSICAPNGFHESWLILEMNVL